MQLLTFFDFSLLTTNFNIFTTSKNNACETLTFFRRQKCTLFFFFLGSFIS